MLSSGIPTIAEYQALESEPQYQELLEHSRFFEDHCQTGNVSARIYGRKWVQDPFLQWSRRWEYVYTAQRVLAWATTRPTPVDLVDAGSGFTFFPFYLMRCNPGLNIDCYDNDLLVGEAMTAVEKVTGFSPSFRREDLEALTQDVESVDAVYSVSVIEHTRRPEQVVNEVFRILKPGGLFVCTFDVSFESRSPMHWSRVAALVEQVNGMFEVSRDWTDLDFTGLESTPGIVTTAWTAATGTASLPWRHPLLVWFYDLVRGRPRGRLYRPMTFCCGTFTKPTAD